MPPEEEKHCLHLIHLSSAAGRWSLARESDKPISRIARDIGISESCLRTWLNQADIDEGRKEGLSTSERDELSRLHKETGC